MLFDAVEAGRSNHRFASAIRALRSRRWTKKAALGPYIAERWGRDEEVQRRNMLERWNRVDPYGIFHDGQAAGIVSIAPGTGTLAIEELYVLPQLQRHGIGGVYRRHGFVASHEAETHVAMELSI